MMSPQVYAPDRGDIIWINFNPQSGKEHKGRRPAFVVSPVEYNRKVGLAIVCPITSQIKGYPFEVLISEKQSTEGVIIADQVKSLDWKVRKAEFIEKAKNEITEEVIKKLLLLIF
ncbi:MAG: endoribonuclease MazF [bacterium]